MDVIWTHSLDCTRTTDRSGHSGHLITGHHWSSVNGLIDLVSLVDSECQDSSKVGSVQ